MLTQSGVKDKEESDSKIQSIGFGEKRATRNSIKRWEDQDKL